MCTYKNFENSKTLVTLNKQNDNGSNTWKKWGAEGRMMILPKFLPWKMAAGNKPHHIELSSINCKVLKQIDYISLGFFTTLIMQTSIIQSKIQLLIILLYFIWVSRWSFKQSAILPFLYFFGFDLKKQSFIKSKYIFIINSWIFDGIIDHYVIDVVEYLDYSIKDW